MAERRHKQFGDVAGSCRNVRDAGRGRGGSQV